MASMLTVDEARQRVLGAVTRLPVVDVALESARGSVLARDVIAPYPLPRFDNSAMDGYAVRAADVGSASPGAEVSLRVVDESKAGSPATESVTAGTAIRIMTGAPVPEGADAIVIVEDTQEDGGTVRVSAPAGPHIRRAGVDIQQGDVAVPAGTELDAGALALLASLGATEVPVHRRPRVAILVTGDELAEDDELQPGQIRDSNSIALRSLVAEAGAETSFYARVPDDLDRTLELFDRAAGDADLVVSSGGVSVGRYDLVRDVVEKLGAIDLWRVAMQPGKPVVLGRVGETPFLGLPGNPVSVHVGFEQFVRPALRKMLGHEHVLRPEIEAVLTEEVTKRPGRLHFVRVALSWDGDRLVATPTGAQGSHIQTSLVGCDGVARFPIEAERLAAGERVTVEVWRLPQR